MDNRKRTTSIKRWIILRFTVYTKYGTIHITVISYEGNKMYAVLIKGSKRHKKAMQGGAVSPAYKTIAAADKALKSSLSPEKLIRVEINEG